MKQPHYLHAEEKLAALRAGDGFRKWKSLDDKRVCVLCEKTFTGRQVEVVFRRAGRLELNCPTEGCHGTPHEWVYPGNPLLSKKAWADWALLLTDDNTPHLTSDTPSAI